MSDPTPPTARELILSHQYEDCPCDSLDDVVRCILAARFEVLWGLHQPVHRQFTRRTSGDVCCKCNHNWPCLTRRILDGGQP